MVTYDSEGLDSNNTPIFNSGFSYTSSSVTNSDGTKTVTFTNSSGTLPTTVAFFDDSAYKSYSDGLYEILYANLSNVTSLYRAFYQCSEITRLDMRGWDFSNITNTSQAFYGCSAITEFIVDGLDCSKVTDASNMFYGMWNLTALTFANVDLSAATNINNLFYYAISLQSADFSGLKLNSSVDTSSMLSSCSELRAVTMDNCTDDVIAKVATALPTRSSSDPGTLTTNTSLSSSTTSALTAKYWNVTASSTPPSGSDSEEEEESTNNSLTITSNDTWGYVIDTSTQDTYIGKNIVIEKDLTEDINITIYPYEGYTISKIYDQTEGTEINGPMDQYAYTASASTDDTPDSFILEVTYAEEESGEDSGGDSGSGFDSDGVWNGAGTVAESIATSSSWQYIINIDDWDSQYIQIDYSVAGISSSSNYFICYIGNSSSVSASSVIMQYGCVAVNWSNVAYGAYSTIRITKDGLIVYDGETSMGSTSIDFSSYDKIYIGNIDSSGNMSSTTPIPAINSITVVGSGGSGSSSDDPIVFQSTGVTAGTASYWYNLEYANDLSEATYTYSRDLTEISYTAAQDLTFGFDIASGIASGSYIASSTLYVKASSTNASNHTMSVCINGSQSNKVISTYLTPEPTVYSANIASFGGSVYSALLSFSTESAELEVIKIYEVWIEIKLVTTELETFTVTFADWDGTVLNTQTVSKGYAAIAPSDPVRDGYTFTGWDVDYSNITSDLTVTAQYTQSGSDSGTEEDTSVKNIYIGSLSINEIYLGDLQISEIYLGDILLYGVQSEESSE